MVGVKGKKNIVSGQVGLPSSLNKHRMWLAFAVVLGLILLAVIIFLAVRPQALFGKAISYTRGDLVVENAPLTLISDASGSYYTANFFSDSKLYSLYITKVGTQTVPLVCSCTSKTSCPTLAECQKQYSSTVG